MRPHPLPPSPLSPTPALSLNDDAVRRSPSPSPPPSPSFTAACHYAVAGGKPVRCCVSGIHASPTVCAVRLMRCGVHSGCAAPVASCAPRLPLYPRCLPCLLCVTTMRATAPATPGAPTPLVMIQVPWRDGAVCAAPPPNTLAGANQPAMRMVHPLLQPGMCAMGRRRTRGL